MGQIYSKASVTIVAAAGKDANSGLPGCGKGPSRKPQHEVVMDDLGALLAHPNTQSAVRNTKWATRGWTYQECYLSRRRLIFTDDQVVYLCNAGYAEECLKLPTSQPFFSPNRRGFSDLIPSDSDNFDEKTRFIQLENKIMEYSRRKLSYGEDSLNALLGVFEHYNTQHNIRHLWGLPIVNLEKVNIKLGWVHRKESSIRRADFPSWSWTGWAGGIRFVSPEHEREDYDIHVNLRSGKSISLSALTQSDELMTAHRHEETKELIIDGFVTRLSFARMETLDCIKHWWIRDASSQPGEYRQIEKHRDFDALWRFDKVKWPGVVSLFEVYKGRFAAIRPILDEEIELEDGMLGLVLRRQGFYNANFRIRSVIILKESDGYFERVGILILDRGGDWRHDQVGEPVWLQKVERRRIRLR